MLAASSPRERLIALVVLVTISGACWAWLGKMLWDMNAMPMSGGSMSMPSRDLGYLTWLVFMWLLMMAAMMLPSAVPMTLVFADFARGTEKRPVSWSILAFIAGYLGAWGVFSLIAAVGQWALERAAFMSSMSMTLNGDAIAGCVVIAAGLYQWTPLKHVCLKKCRTPIGFLMTQWRDGSLGALTMGWNHGLFCVGCCWALMALLFVAGVMNPLWIIGLTLFVIIEKIAPFGDWISKAAGTILIVAGSWLLIA